MIAFILLATVSACGSGGQDSLPEEFLGQWYYTGSSGGLAGDGMGDDASGYIVINADHTIDHHDEDGSLVGSSEYTVSRGQTIFNENEQWILNADSGLPEVIQISDDGQLMSLAENVYDGFQRSYARSR